MSHCEFCYWILGNVSVWGFAITVAVVLVVLLAVHISRQVSIMFGQVGNGLEATHVYLVV